MQINKYGKGLTNANGAGDAVGNAAGRVKQKGQTETYGKNDRNKMVEESFHESLQKSMHMETYAEAGTLGISGEGGWRSGSGVVSHKEQGFGKAENISIRVEHSKEQHPVKEVEVRRISYGECDKVEINVLEGYTLKAKLEGNQGEGGVGENSIYVEMKEEDGSMKACLFETAGLQRDSSSAMERIAYAVVHNGEEM